MNNAAKNSDTLATILSVYLQLFWWFNKITFPVCIQLKF